MKRSGSGKKDEGKRRGKEEEKRKKQQGRDLRNGKGYYTGNIKYVPLSGPS